MTEDQENPSNVDAREPLFDVPDNLRRDGSNYVEWIWSLLDDGIDIPLSGSFVDLRTETGERLPDPDMVAYLDDQMKVARRAADARGHSLQDVITCCRARGLDAGPLADEFCRLFFTDCEAALSRARAIGEICEVAENFCKEALNLKASLATDSALPRQLRRVIDASLADG